MRKEFSLRGLRDLTIRLNKEPSLIEQDWRSAFYDAFEMTVEQKSVLEGLDGKANQLIQGAFRKAATAARNGGSIRLRVSNELDRNRRVLRLEINQLQNDETLPGEPDGSLDLICCCADCKCWHRCGTRPNPCAKPECQ